MWIQKVPGGGVLALAWSPDGRTLYTKDGGGYVSAWDAAARTGRRILRTSHRYSGGFGLAGNGRYLVSVGDTVFAWGTRSNTIRTLNPEVGDQLPAVSVHPDPVAPRLLILVEGGRSLRTWDLAAWRGGPKQPGWDYRGDPESLTLTPDGRALVQTDDAGTLAVFDLAAGAELARFRPRIDRDYYLGYPAPDRRTVLLVHDHDVFLWDLTDDRLRAGPIRSFHPAVIRSFHPAAPVFAALDAGRHLTLFGLGTGEPLRSLDFGLGTQVQCVAFAPDGLTCAVGGSNRQFAVFDVDV